MKDRTGIEVSDTREPDKTAYMVVVNGELLIGAGNVSVLVSENNAQALRDWLNEVLS